MKTARSKKRAYGTGSVYKSRGRWVAKWYQNGKPAYIYGLTTKAEALKALKTKAGSLNNELTIGNHWEKFLESRKITNVSWKNDEYRWNKHLSYLNDLIPSDLSIADIKTLVETKLKEGLSPTSIRLIIKLMSSFYGSLQDTGIITENIFKSIPRSIKRLYKPAYDWKLTPWIKSVDHINTILNSSTNIDFQRAYALGVFAGLRPGEILALRDTDVDLINNQIIVKNQLQNGNITCLKDKESRIVPIINRLRPYLINLSPGFIVNNYNKPQLRKELKTIIDTHNLPRVNWYQSTRHSYSSQWVSSGLSIYKLSSILGHSSVTTTERYGHLAKDRFIENDYLLMGT